jgi:hypothetical protein
VCEFLEHATSPAAAASQSIEPLIILAAARLLGRFLTDAPELHSDQVRKLLPQLLALQDGGPAAAAEQQQLPVPVVSFMLAAMVMWTSQHSPQHEQWVAFMMDPASRCLQSVAGLAGQAAAASAAAAAAPLHGSSGGDTAAALLQAAEAQLGTACQVLQQLLASVPAVLAHAGSSNTKQQQSGVLGLQEQQSAALAAALEHICAWASVRQQQHQASTAPAVEANLLASLAATGLELSVLLPAAALAGQLLQRGVVREASAGGAARLLVWGCHMGWCFKLASAAGRGGGAGGGGTQALLVELAEVWELADLDELWDAALLAAADAVAARGPAGACVAQALEAAGQRSWLAAARAGAGAGGAAAAVVVQDSLGMQLLLQATTG